MQELLAKTITHPTARSLCDSWASCRLAHSQHLTPGCHGIAFSPTKLPIWQVNRNFLRRCMECRRGLAMRKLFVRPSVRLSVKRVDCDKTEERSAQIFISYERSFSIVFWEEWLVGATPLTGKFGSTGPHWSEIADFQQIFACSASAITPSEKSSINTNRKSTTRFPISLRWSSYVARAPAQNAKRPIIV